MDAPHPLFDPAFFPRLRHGVFDRAELESGALDEPGIGDETNFDDARVRIGALTELFPHVPRGAGDFTLAVARVVRDVQAI